MVTQADFSPFHASLYCLGCQGLSLPIMDPFLRSVFDNGGSVPSLSYLWPVGYVVSLLGLCHYYLFDVFCIGYGVSLLPSTRMLCGSVFFPFRVSGHLFLQDCWGFHTHFFSFVMKSVLWAFSRILCLEY